MIRFPPGWAWLLGMLVYLIVATSVVECADAAMSNHHLLLAGLIALLYLAGTWEWLSMIWRMK